ncbi:MAG: hypothetical protein ACOC42_01430 [Halobacteriota archaeon]
MMLPPLKVGDPVMDAAQGRPMVVLETPGETVETWSQANNYDLTDNYGNSKFGVDPDEPVVVSRYVSDVSSDPGKTYTFPRSRLRLIDVHHADDGWRIYDRIAFDILESMAERYTTHFMMAEVDDLRRTDLPIDEGVLDAAIEFAKATTPDEEVDDG